MTYYVAKSVDIWNYNKYICINEDMNYSWWFNSLSAITVHALRKHDKHSNSITVQEWLAAIPDNNMEFVLSFTKLSHPEFFI